MLFDTPLPSANPSTLRIAFSANVYLCFVSTGDAPNKSFLVITSIGVLIAGFSLDNIVEFNNPILLSTSVGLYSDVNGFRNISFKFLLGNIESYTTLGVPPIAVPNGSIATPSFFHSSSVSSSISYISQIALIIAVPK